jgi:hypothetical protein
VGDRVTTTDHSTAPFLHDVGCSPAQAFVVKKLDSDYFVEE